MLGPLFTNAAAELLFGRKKKSLGLGDAFTEGSFMTGWFGHCKGWIWNMEEMDGIAGMSSREWSYMAWTTRGKT